MFRLQPKALFDRPNSEGFTLVELLVAVAVLVLVIGIVAVVMQSTTRVIHQAASKLTAFATARSGFDSLTQRLSEATLNTYWDYYGTPKDGSGNLSRRTPANASSFAPLTYGRASDLQFLIKENTQNSGYGEEVYFQSPQAYSLNSSYQSTRGLLNACGYYVQYGSDQSFLPSLIGTKRWRYRLIQGLEPTENLQIFQATSLISPNTTTDNLTEWLTNIQNSGAGTMASNVVPLADNVICMIVWPRLPEGQDTAGTALTSNYAYDSQLNIGAFSGAPPVQPVTANQLPPTLQITLVVIDEASAAHIDTHSATPPPVIENALALSGGLFKSASVASYTNDLNTLQTALTAGHINFEVLNSTIVMRESKWSQ